MSETQPQNLQNHGRTDPWFLALLIIVILNCVFATVNLIRGPHTFRAAWETLFSAALIILVFRVRQYPLKAQDRLIRLEERLRLQALAPPEWRPQILRLTESQLVGLRFAGDVEVVALAQQALAENLSRKQIKERIRNWRADHFRV